jgi:antitoxin CptB
LFEKNPVDEKRLVWACRRGMLELDLILLPFLEKVYPTLSAEDKKLYWTFLKEEDQDIYAWCMRRDDPKDQGLQRIVEIIRDNTGLQPAK